MLHVGSPERAAVRPGARPSDLILAGLFTVTSFAASCLLFAVEPMVGKLVLPLFGGAASVWNVCLLFFQVALVVGYGYAHASWRRFGPRQPWVHLALLLLPLPVLPLALPNWAAPPDGAAAALWLLLVLTVAVGAPFVAVSTTAPLLQAWLAATDHAHARDPYFLYAAGNAGSLVALLAYPVLLEPALPVRSQTAYWSVGYAVLLVLVVACALAARARRRLKGGEARASEARASGASANVTVTARRRLRWLLLAALPSSALLGVTTYLSTDVAAVPLLWVFPLAVYLATFVVAFGQRWPTRWRALGSVLLAAVTAVLVAQHLRGARSILLVAALALLVFALLAYACHRRLAEDRPPARNLTGFYLTVAVGGALGGAFNSLVAPVLFPTPIEYGLVLGLCVLVVAPRFAGGWRGLGSRRAVALAVAGAVGPCAVAAYLLRGLPAAGVAIGAVFLAAGLLASLIRPRMFAPALAVVTGLAALATPDTVLTSRSFYGVYRVTADDGRHYLSHGSTVHGWQDLRPERREEPTAYYSRGGPLGDVYDAYHQGGDLTRVAAVGLGVGTVAAYGSTGDELTFYELDQRMVDIASDPRAFTFLRDCAARVDVVVGDGRLELARAPEGSYQMIVLDAFSSDSIPVHLLTTQAFEMYGTKLAPDGLLVVHITNRNLDLEPVVAGVAGATGFAALVRADRPPRTNRDASASTWAALARDPARLDPLRARPGWRAPRGRAGTTWTDDHSNIVGILKLR